MEKQDTNSSKNIKTGLQQEVAKAGESSKAADEKSQEDGDKKLPENPETKARNQEAKEIDELVQGKKLDDTSRGGDVSDTSRGGDVSDTDEFKKEQDAFD
ncbi:MAG: hypothetical protein JWP81_2703 [Ferruginibacter sp.]|nr:hypothetical protein [Ferruginibacter sp.]